DASSHTATHSVPGGPGRGSFRLPAMNRPSGENHTGRRFHSGVFRGPSGMSAVGFRATSPVAVSRTAPSITTHRPHGENGCRGTFTVHGTLTADRNFTGFTSVTVTSSVRFTVCR